MKEFIDSDEYKNVTVKANKEQTTESRNNFNQKYNYKKINIIEISNNKNNNITFNKLDLSNSNIPQNIISLLTYNFFCRPPPIKTNKSDYKDARLNDFYQQLENYDIICFQELFTTLNDRKHRMIREGAKVGLKYYYSSKVPSFFSKYLCDSGLLILSKYEIVDNDSYEYYINISGDSVSNKGILYAKIKINDKFLFLFNTHLQASYFDDSPININCTIQVRMSQTEELINYVYNKLLNIPRDEVNSGCVIIAGDFNIDANDYRNINTKYKKTKYNCTEYEIFEKKLKKLGTVIDVMKQKLNGHEYTFGNNENGYDKILTGKADMNSKQTLDYIWEIIPDFNLPIYNHGMNKLNKNYSYDDKNCENHKIKVLYDTFQVQHFLVKNRPYQQLSDHFGISVDLSTSKNQSLNNSFNEETELPLKNT